MKTSIFPTTQTTNQTAGVPPAAPEAHPMANVVNLGILLAKAVTEPGIVSTAYRRFHRYSLSNQILAATQLLERRMPLAPIASYTQWQKLGRSVRRGEKALGLLMPVTIKHWEKDESGIEVETGLLFTRFKFARHWFSLDQTEGEDFNEPELALSWSAAQALEHLNIEERAFEMLNGNVQGYATGRTIAVSPLAEYPQKTYFHELAHVVLGHTEITNCTDTMLLPRHIEEAEAEGVAFLLCALLELPGLAESRGYIQSWLDGQALPEKSAQRIFVAAQTLLAAGRGD
jgi:antirestriction protein ArdC